MSFFSTILDIGSSVLDFGRTAVGTVLNFGQSALTSNRSQPSIGGQLARMAITGLVLNQVNRSVNRASNVAVQKQPDPGVRLQLEPNQNNRIPVLYGEAFVPGMITDAHISADQKTMTYVFTVSECTGVKISDSLETTYEFEDAYLNDQRVVFKNDGITVDYTLDRDGNQDISLQDLVTIRVYAGSGASADQLSQEGGSAVTPVTAWSVVPTWTDQHEMNQLIFVVVTVVYNAEKGLKSVPTMLMHLRSSMTLPGDVLWDYATNARYGAGIAEESIYRE